MELRDYAAYDVAETEKLFDPTIGLGPYELALEYALAHDVDMTDFDYAIEQRGAEQTLADYRSDTYVGPWVDPDTGESL